LSAADVGAVLAVFAAGAVQSGTGFGFALLCVPVLSAIYGPVAAVASATVLGLGVNVLTLSGERRPSALLRRPAAALVLWAVPGTAIGAVVLARAPEGALRLLVAASVLAAVAVRLLAPSARQTTRSRGILAGGLSGALGTSTGVNGPLVVLYLLRRGATPAESRDTLAAFFLATGVLGLVALALAGALRPGPHLVLLVAAAIAGQLAGRLIFARIGERHEAISLVLLCVSAVVAAVPALV
jgi:uncharacterized membrane protein YfcA